ncbi:MAG: hypothetical protein PHD13_05705 [Methanocellales archaeon]|nr:hypothetical protein [Methanocellales archaeon]MDD3291949.1 hypothetical protein [Methanocellales archaeon]MDD5235650.1 hypothetical protein [Methanocellales archaeon]MDD5485497.1 hypothetical protein [Methanocellales archaeon]
MAFVWDPIYVVNLVLSVIILGLGLWTYQKSKNKTALYVGLAFGLFGFSHAMTLLGLKDALEVLLIVIRTIAYLLVVFAVYKLWKG